VSAARFDHVLVVGGSGMLAGCCRALLKISNTVTVMARREERIRAVAPAILPLICDCGDPAEMARALKDLTADLIVVWLHTAMPEQRRRLAEQVRPGGHFLQVLGSAHGDPARPDLLDERKRAADGLSIMYQAVMLGFIVEGGNSRWLTEEEISDGVFAAIESGEPLSVVGTVRPWSARPHYS
jgi:NAD(P)-dependent dehydrogenase (short-subunit alcohol dehydrogenase family)